MNTKYKDKSFLKGVGYCLNGISYTFSHERNFRFEIILGILVVILSFILKISLLEWVIIVFSIFIVLVLELINTAFEAMVDLYTDKYNKGAKIVKDVIAGAVLTSAFFSAIMGILIFLPKIISLINK